MANIKIGEYHYSEFSFYLGKSSSIDSISEANGIVIPNDYISIGSIFNCTGIIIPDTIISIGNIYGCNLTIPASVESITKIEGCGKYGTDSNKIVIALKSKIPPMLGKLVGISDFDILMVPQGALNTYKNHPLWGQFKNISENPRLNSSSDKTEGAAGSNDEILEIRNEIAELKNEIADLKYKINNQFWFLF